MAVDKQEIEKLLDEYFWITGGFSISDTGLVSVKGDVKLEKNCSQLPVRFDRVRGYFDCENKELKTLEGAPQWVSGSFWAGVNQLKNLNGVPQWVGDTFSCVNNQLENLKGAPQWVGGNFWCNDNQLKTLEGAPQWVGGGFDCNTNPLKSLKGMPLYVGGNFAFEYNETLPLCEIITRKIKDILIFENPPELMPIIMKYRNTGYQGMLPFATELIRAGYGSNAWL
jgi:hypothetical protein